MTWIAIASRCCRPWTGTSWWTIPRRTSVAVPPPSVNLSVRWQFANRKTSPGLKWVSVNRHMSIPCCPRKWSSSFFLPRTPSVFQQASRKTLVHVVRLGRAALFSYEEDDVFEHSPRASQPRFEGWDGCEEPASEFHTCVKREVHYKIGNFDGWMVGLNGATSSLGLGCETCRGFAGLFDLVAGACLGPTMILAADFALLPFFLVVVTSFRFALPVYGPEAG